MRKAIIAGNWKMNHTVTEGKSFMDKFSDLVKDAEAEVVICVPFTAISEISKMTKGTNVKLGAQNIHYEDNGAFTGEISGLMLKEFGVEYVIIGHSERREYFNETDKTVNLKIKKAFECGITPIFCCGETLKEREAKLENVVIENQIKKGLEDISPENAQNLVIAYEPIWAIGTGKTATTEQAQDIIGFIRRTIENLYNKEVSEKVRIQYGGSVKADTIKEKMMQPDIDGALVGGASLVADDFARLIKY